MIQVIGIPMGSDPASFFANLFLAHKEADWFKTQRKLLTINVWKIKHYLTNEIILASSLQGCHFTAPFFLAKCSMGALEQSFLEFLEESGKLKIFLVLVYSC